MKVIIKEPVQITIMQPEQLILPDDTPRTAAQLTDLHYRGHEINKRTKSIMRSWLWRENARVRYAEKKHGVGV